VATYTAELSSLLRVVAFLGLGLSLLGLSYFHQKSGLELTNLMMKMLFNSENTINNAD
jgi:hypothetical protein